jgi:hypothetical protein
MLMLAVAFVMMVVAAPGHGHVRVHPAKPSVVLLTTDLSHAAAFTPALLPGRIVVDPGYVVDPVHYRPPNRP